MKYETETMWIETLADAKSKLDGHSERFATENGFERACRKVREATDDRGRISRADADEIMNACVESGL